MKKNNIKQVFSDAKLMINYVWKGDKLLFLYKFVLIIFTTIQTVIGSLFLKWIVDSLQTKTLNDSLFVIGLIQLVSFLVYSVTTWFGRIIIPRSEYKLRNYLQNEFIRKAIKQDLECYEDFEFYDNYTKAVRIADGKALDFINIFASIIQQIVTILALISVIISLDYVLLIFTIIIIIISFFDNYKSSFLSHELYEAEQSINRRSEYVKRVSHHRQFAKEVRIFNLGAFLIKKLNDTFEEKFKLYKNYNAKYWKIKYIVSLINTILITPLLLGYLVYQTFNSNITLGSFTVLFGICFSISSQFASILTSISNLKFESKYYVSHLRGILEYQPKIENDIIKKEEIHDIFSIEFKNVFFSYPKHQKQVLNNINFRINRGEKLAIVGKNGVGKSTIIKLLLRLYDVSEGEILINDKNIKEFNIESLRKCFSSTMQDFNIYAFTIIDNLAMGKEKNDDLLYSALDFSNMRERISNLENSTESYISREFDEKGVEFSGGELQKLAIARAYYNKNSVFVLDEANSALDPIAEYDLNIKLSSILSDQIVLFVTHRLSTTTNADCILVIDDGEIIGKGTHSQLMSESNLYNDMFNKQAQAYMSNKEVKKYE